MRQLRHCVIPVVGDSITLRTGLAPSLQIQRADTDWRFTYSLASLLTDRRAREINNPNIVPENDTQLMTGTCWCSVSNARALIICTRPQPIILD